MTPPPTRRSRSCARATAGSTPATARTPTASAPSATPASTATTPTRPGREPTMRVHNPGTVVQVFLPLTTYELSALRLLLQADIARTERDNPHTGPGPDPRAW